MRSVLARRRRCLHIAGVGPGFLLSQRERAELLTVAQFREPPLFLFVRPE